MHDATSREFWKALGTYPLPLGEAGGYRRRGRVSNGNVTLCKRNSLNGTFRNIRGGGGGGGALFRATVLPARFGVEAAAVSIRMHD